VRDDELGLPAHGNDGGEATGPLVGLRVIDCSRGVAGWRTTGMLADYGADVIWVEPPGGDPCRAHLPAAASAFNRGKRSIELDLHDADARGRVLDLVAGADVFVQTWRPGVAARLGLGVDDVHRRSRRAVYCSISGFGTEGPHRDLPGHEALVHALVGTMAEQAGHRDGPIFEGLPFASIGASYLALIGTLAALYRRHLDGVGRHVETSLVDGALAYLSMLWGESDTATGGMPALGAHRIVARSFLCGDGTYLGVHTGAVGAFGRLMVALGLADRIPPSETGMDLGVPLTPEQRTILETEIHAIFASRPRSEWVRLLREADVCAIEHLPACEVFDQPQPQANGMVVEVDDPVLGGVQQVAPAAKFSATPAAVRHAAPTPGQHTDEVLTELDDAGAAAIDPAPCGAIVGDRPLLDGVRILDLGAYYAGPYSSRLLADLGADVLKVEPIAGDPLRGMERPFFSAQAGKRSLAADLKADGLAPAVRRMIENADVLHHNLRPGAAERLGLGWEQASAANPELVYLYAPGWGSSGPDARRQSFAPMLSGYVGVGFECAGQFNPPLFPSGNEDPGNGLLGAVAVLMALLHRQRTGRGQYVENPQLNATMAHMAHVVRQADGTVVGAGLLDPLQLGHSPLERLYETADGWLVVVALDDDQIAGLGRVTGVDLCGDERLATPAGREAHGYELGMLLADAFAARKTAEWLDELAAAGVPAAEPAPPNMAAFLRDPEQRRTGRVAELAHPDRGVVRELAVLVRVSDAMVPPHRLAPALGQHTTEVLVELGYEHDPIAELRACGAIR
jgi:crotonobetainyl-CoA:carnitine CoA-transferase CaiB-like acyl-CoA transferase